MSNKNKKKNKGQSAEGVVDAEVVGSAEGESSETTVEDPKVVKTRKPRSPLGPLPVRLCDKADKVYEMVSDMSKQAASRGAPQETCEAARAFVSQVESWRDVFFKLKESGWEPSATAVKSVIQEGDAVQLLPEHVARYSFIEGLADGSVKLVAGSVDQVNKMIVQVMLKGEDGRFYGYCPRQYLVRR